MKFCEKLKFYSYNFEKRIVCYYIQIRMEIGVTTNEANETIVRPFFIYETSAINTELRIEK